MNAYLADQTRRQVLNWSRRFQIICGIARGLLYLHLDFRLSSIHRDQKASNVLLDSKMNSEISDFGTARTFGGDQTEANTNRVFGTFFGILLLEIISGRRTREFYHPNHSGNLIEQAWSLWKEGGPLDLDDDFLVDISMNAYLADQTRRQVLNWSKRFQIICGIARGLLYLHLDSRLSSIHRDRKASNVLLDSKMNSEISDFGTARTFGGDQTEANTNRVVGTYFGILLLEIISGRRTRRFCHPNHSGNLIEQAWSLWAEGGPLDLDDDFLVDIGNLSEVFQCIDISLLRVQQHPEDRPSMSS
ncbi:receptor-like serine/threonine-protein kinase SD1-7 [Durio zibethinus]|uniref:non-specific serine/threonine protein kinase n=1 Tax=Durio zibethinus TaxID=66656 RepID=A0A6P5Y573_DURZI|nr:receptor-like serine/threonine-protein kinase SD1-7 [Durio zibethinus]